MRLIDLDKLKDAEVENYKPIEHGYLKHKIFEGNLLWTCSKCGKIASTTNYCSNCGATLIYSKDRMGEIEEMFEKGLLKE